MKKSDLRTGMLVQLKSGRWFMVQMGARAIDNPFRGNYSEDYLIEIPHGYYVPLDEFAAGLEYRINDKHDVAKIAEIDYIGRIFRAISKRESVESIVSFKVIWEREEEGQGNEKE